MECIKKDSAILIVNGIWLSLLQTYYGKDFILVNDQCIFTRIIAEDLLIRFTFC